MLLARNSVLPNELARNEATRLKACLHLLSVLDAARDREDKQAIKFTMQVCAQETRPFRGFTIDSDLEDVAGCRRNEREGETRQSVTWRHDSTYHGMMKARIFDRRPLFGLPSSPSVA